jgi:two-component system, NtrC family, sensor kinase
VTVVKHASRLWTALAGIGGSVGAKLFVLLAGSLLLVLGLLGYLNLRLHQNDLEELTLQSAESVSDIMKHSFEFSMMRNDREALYHTIDTISREPGVQRIRIFNEAGRVSFSTDPEEVGTFVDKTSEACSGCHEQIQPRVELDRHHQFRIDTAGHERLVRVINPITNSPACSEADCHAHPASQRVLGVLDTNLSLAYADEHLARNNLRILGFSVASFVGITLLIALFIWRVVDIPVKRLHRATTHLQKGDLGYLTKVGARDQIGELALSFNEMSRELQAAHQELTDWNRMLEERVRVKSEEVQRVHAQMLQAEKLTSLGKLAAVVAHEINNPLSGILTYARLVRRWVEKGDISDERRAEIQESLQLIESESRRCGDLVKDLLTFARQTPMNVQPVDLNAIARMVLRLVEHKLDMVNVTVELTLEEQLPQIEGDTAQLQQLLLALVLNAIDAMPREGVLRIRSASVEGSDEVELAVEDNGAGIPDEVRARLFEPFVTTKETGGGVGLGLAISHQIVERHGARIEVDSEAGRGTRFTMFFPIRASRQSESSLLAAV